MRVAVIGAGPAGMTAALQLSRGGADVAVYEASSRIGGMAGSLDLWGHRVDFGPHRFFSTDTRVNRLWLDVVGDDYGMVERRTRIYYAGRFFHYPLRPIEAAWTMGPLCAAQCVASYLGARSRSGDTALDESSFETWVVERFGRRLFEMFFKSYSEKLWGIPCAELSADFAAQRIKQFSLAGALSAAWSRPHASRHRTLVDRFAYPSRGTGAVYERMAELIRAGGGQVHLDSPVRRLTRDGSRISGVELSDGRRENFDHVISTMPLTLLVRGLAPPADVQAAADALQFRNTVLVYLHVESDDLFDDQWLYIHAPELTMGRVTNFRNWLPRSVSAPRTSVLAAEFWCNDGDATWTEDDPQLIDRATRELRTAGLLGAARVLAGHVERIPRCYPVYRRGYQQHVQRLADYLQTFTNLTVIGRYGAFKYNNQDHSILMGLLAADNLLAHRGHNLWSINTDYDAYQERSVITERGLLPESVAAIREVAVG
jgi:protoporphyrinogen oxidase